MLAVKELRGVTPAERIVLYAFADYADKAGGSVWPSLLTIADECEIDERTARRIVRRLEARGLVSVAARRGIGGRATNAYELLFVGEGASRPPRGGVGGADIPPDPVIRSSSIRSLSDLRRDPDRIGSGGNSSTSRPPRNHGAIERVIRRA